MTEFAVGRPSKDEIDDALEALEDVLRLDEIGEVDICPYLRGLLLQLTETLADVRPLHA